MAIFLALTIIMIVGIMLMCNGKEVGMVPIVISGMLLLIAVLTLLTHPMEVESDITRFLATEVTIEIARKAGVDVENAAIQHKIIESNQWLAQEQYYNATIFDWWIPDEVDNLKPIR